MTTELNATRQQWLAARLDLLEEEKALTRQSDALAIKRQQLPRVRIGKQYRFDTAGGNVSLEDLFGGRSQLLVYHFMFGPDYTAGCPSCSSIADGFNGFFLHLENHDVAFWAVSRAPLAKLEAFKRRMDWSFPWASSFGSDFNGDFSVWFSAEQQHQGEVDYNYRREPPAPQPLAARTVQEWQPRDNEAPITQIAAMTGTDVPTYTRDRPGVSAFELIDGAVYHSYSSYARGLDGLWGMYQWLDRAPKGRNETGIWWRHHDRYGKE
ncbi:thioredoxin family protein [Rhizobium brockwellii]|uniref:Thioredoxin family protein n=1 Tax=Rhizobium brockwellii TaxID=3019932 RepID=A0ABU3YDU0_9HYPH|nr:thioredoxin family protein [Rhizobium brockwellii]MDV4177032.1 thioredoxin family protein [Rhizobium brockwellii]MDV4184031.1 thioredoxin family protein [Rhizobium brockwellii]